MSEQVLLRSARQSAARPAGLSPMCAPQSHRRGSRTRLLCPVLHWLLFLLGTFVCCFTLHIVVAHGALCEYIKRICSIRSLTCYEILSDKLRRRLALHGHRFCLRQCFRYHCMRFGRHFQRLSDTCLLQHTLCRDFNIRGRYIFHDRCRIGIQHCTQLCRSSAVRRRTAPDSADCKRD